MTIKIPRHIDKTSLLLFMAFLFPAVGNYLWWIISIVIPVSYSVFRTIVWAIVAILALPFFIRKLRLKHYYIYLSFVLFTLLQWVLANNVAFKFETLIVLLLSLFPSFFIGAAVEIEQKTFEPLFKLSIFALCVSIAYSFYFLLDRTLLSDNMDFAYKVLPAMLFIASGIFIKEKKTFSIILSVVSLMFLLALGTRGPILCFLSFVLLMMIKYVGFAKISVISIVICVLATIIINSSLYTFALLKVSDKLNDMGFSTRIVEMLLNDEVADANGRDVIQEELLNEIRESPLSVRGMLSDRISTIDLINSLYGVSNETGTYAHNIFIELLHNFGIVIGGGLLLLLLVSVFRLFFRCRKDAFYIVAICICMGFIHLIVSGSYLEAPGFFMMIGLFTNESIPNAKVAKKSERLMKHRKSRFIRYSTFY